MKKLLLFVSLCVSHLVECRPTLPIYYQTASQVHNELSESIDHIYMQVRANRKTCSMSDFAKELLKSPFLSVLQKPFLVRVIEIIENKLESNRISARTARVVKKEALASLQQQALERGINIDEIHKNVLALIPTPDVKTRKRKSHHDTSVDAHSNSVLSIRKSNAISAQRSRLRAKLRKELLVKAVLEKCTSGSYGNLFSLPPIALAFGQSDSVIEQENASPQDAPSSQPAYTLVKREYEEQPSSSISPVPNLVALLEGGSSELHADFSNL